MRNRLVVSILIGLLSGLICYNLLTHLQRDAGDFTPSIRGARDILEGRDPYDYVDSRATPGTPYIPYPLTATLLGIPFIYLPYSLGGAIFFGVSSALLAFSLTNRSYAPLIVFLSYPYWDAMLQVQWSPLMMAAASLPLLLSFVTAKPQLGLPIVLTWPSLRGLLLCAGWILISLIIMPTWPLRWFSQIGGYQHFFPLLTIVGPFLLLALLHWRDKSARFLLLMAIFPQRWFYDELMLWLIPQTLRELLVTTLISWFALIWRFEQPITTMADVGLICDICFYLPMLTIILLRYRRHQGELQNICIKHIGSSEHHP